MSSKINNTFSKPYTTQKNAYPLKNTIRHSKAKTERKDFLTKQEHN